MEKIKLSKTESIILKSIKEYPKEGAWHHYCRTDFSMRTIYRYYRILQEKGILERTGNHKKGGTWIIHDEKIDWDEKSTS